MRIAVTYENGNIFQHFGHTERFKVYDVEDGEVKLKTVVNTDGSGHGALADILKKIEVGTLICGGIGAGARLALAEAGIRLYPGAEGGADDAVRALLAGALHYQPDYVCGHHKDEPPRVCGSHTCSAACYHETSEERSE